MLYDVNSMNVKALLVALYARAEAERRQRALQSEIDKVKRRMVKPDPPSTDPSMR